MQGTVLLVDVAQGAGDLVHVGWNNYIVVRRGS